MFDLVLYQPEIPPNTGNIIRLCANSGTRLHLVKPLGFSIEDKQLVRAGLDYHEFATVRTHESWEACKHALGLRRLFALTTKGARRHCDTRYQAEDVFVMGPETRGLPADVLAEFAADRQLRIPMRPDVRSLNLSNAAAIVVYEAWRQIGFAGAV